MSTPISGSSGAGLLNTLLAPARSGSAGQTGSSQLAALTGPGGLLSDALGAALQASASVSQLELAFGQAMQGATPVDPSTGQREVSASAGTQLSAALNSFLLQSGFSQQQAEAATTGFAAQLAKGGPIDLDASFDESSTVASSMSANYGSQTMSASTVAVNERSGSVSIAFDPTSGKLSVSLNEQQVATTTSVTEIAGPGPLVPLSLRPVDLMTLLPGQGQGDNTGANDATNGQNAGALVNDTTAATDADSTLRALIAGLTQPTLHGAQEAQDFLSRVPKSGQADNAAAGGDAAAGGTQQQDAAAPATTVTIGFTQSLSISMNDLQGHGATLFKRPDGSTGAMSFEPTHVEA